MKETFNCYFTFFKVETLLKRFRRLPSLSDVKCAQRSTFQSSHVQVAVNFRFIEPLYVHQLVQLAVTVNDCCCQFEIFPDEFSRGMTARS